jgi:hypothetical protein
MNRPIIKKIPLSELLEILSDLYNKGVDYIDILAPEDPTEDDRMTIKFTKEYFSPELEFEEGDEPLLDDEEDILDIQIVADTKLSDEDLNQLL